MSYLKLGSIASVSNGKRNAQDAVESGQYPLFDRSSTIKKSDKYLFDKEAVIVPGEGRQFLPKYINGKFDLHQRCYAIFDFKDDYKAKYIYYYIKWNQKYFQSVYTGSTVPSLRLNNFLNMPVKQINAKEQETIIDNLERMEKSLSLKKNKLSLLDELIKSRFIRQEVFYAY